MVNPLFALALAMAAPSGTSADSQTSVDPCSIDGGVGQNGAHATRGVATRDLATLADIGRVGPYASPTPIGVSPNGLSAAFVVRRANPDTNSYCQRLILVEASGGRGHEVDRGGEFMRASMSLWRLAALQAGFAAVVAPRWSPDGQAVAYLKRLGGSTQIWTMDVVSGRAVQATHSASDIEDFRWSPDGGAFVIAHI